MRIPVTDLEALVLPPPTEEAVPDQSGGSLKIGLLGAGQAGCRIAESFFNAGYTKAIGVNTTTQDATSLEHFILLQTPGQPGGAGKDPQVAFNALSRYTPDLYAKMSSVFGEVDHIFITVGLGGGTGSGCAEVLVQLATRYLANLNVPHPEQRVGVIAALPKSSELSSPHVKDNARQISDALSTLATNHQISPFILIDNAKLEALYRGQVPMARMYPRINNVASQVFAFFNEISASPSEYMTFDGRDFQRIVEAGGHMTYGLITLQTKDFASREAISRKLQIDLDRTLLSSDFELAKAQYAAVIVTASEKKLAEDLHMQEMVDHVYDSIGAIAGNATLFRGLYSRPDDTADSNNDTVFVYTLLGGLPTPVKRYARLR